MAKLESNIFPIVNLDQLSSAYRLYRLKGLHPGQSEYYRNRQYIINKISRQLRNPVTVIEQDETPYLVVRDDLEQDPPSPLTLTRTAVILEKSSDTLELDYTVRSRTNDIICLRFLRFAIQGELYKRNALWQPYAGGPFFEKQYRKDGSLARYPGFIVRPVTTHDGGIGLSIDVTSKTLSARPLPTNLSRNQFHRWKGVHCVYHYGHDWYEIILSALSDFNVSEYPIPDDGEITTLLKFINQKTRKPIPKELAQLPHDASVVLYQTADNEDRAAPTPLCYQVYGTDDASVGRQHGRTITPPHVRRKKINEVVVRYMNKLKVGETQLQISPEPIIVPNRMFVVPDIQFGNSKVLSVRGTDGAEQVSLDRLGAARRALLYESGAGFYDRDPLQRQYLILPESVANSFGQRLLEDLKEEVNKLFPQEYPYDPIVMTYDDSGPKTFANQGNAIRRMLKEKQFAPGYAVIMTHYTTDRELRDEHQLDALAINELRQLDVFAAVIHSATGQECYHLVTKDDGTLEYEPKPQKRGKITGYIHNVALNKVLLTNQRWPFVLATKLHADMTIGIDVKNHTAGLLVVGEHGSKIRSLTRDSKQKEKLLKEQLHSYLIEVIEQEANTRTSLIRTIVIHRDGQMYQSEIEGAHSAIEQLISDGIISPDATLTILEIPKHPTARVRLFDVEVRSNGREWVENPEVGYYYIVNNADGYICSTGRTFPRPGTTNPLYVKKLEGALPFEQCLEDVYALTALTWTKPDDCSRYPITIKLNDRYLVEDASEYDEDQLNFVIEGHNSE